jgi:hypothetical protein
MRVKDLNLIRCPSCRVAWTIANDPVFFKRSLAAKKRIRLTVSAVSVAFDALDNLRTVGDEQDWAALEPLHKAYEALKKAREEILRNSH